MDLGLRDRVFVVTAASGGLGRATADQLVAEGARVVLVARRADVLARAVAELGGHDHAVAVPADLADPTTADRCCAAAVAAFGRLDGALISVGGPPAGPVIEMTDEQWLAAFGSVFLPALRVSRSVLAHASGSVSLAWVLSTSVKAPLDGLAISNGLRPGLAMVLKQLADEIGPDGHRVVGLMPGRVVTERLHQLDALSGHRAEVEARIPLRRSGRPDEFGRVATFVLSPAASFMTGSMIAVDGGNLRSL